MAAGFLNKAAGDRFDVASVGIESAIPDPAAAVVMREIGLDITGQKSQTVRESLTHHFACVVSIADASRERSPIFPSPTNLLKWYATNPSVTSAVVFERIRDFRMVRDQLGANVQAVLKQFVWITKPALRRTA